MSLFTNADVESFKADRLVSAASAFWPGVQLSNGYLLQQLHAAEAEVARTLKTFLEPTTVFPYEPRAEEIDALDGAPYAEEPGYDYDADFFRAESWGYIVTRSRPIISVAFVRMAYPDPHATFYAIPQQWLRVDKKYGQIRLVPASQSFTAPLSAFLMQALSGGRSIPSMIQVKYVAGLQGVRTDPRWADLLDVIMKKAALKVLEGAFPPQSGSISGDGLSQSLSVDPSKYRDLIQETMFGPKGSNGGLWTSIHGLGMTALGVGA